MFLKLIGTKFKKLIKKMETSREAQVREAHFLSGKIIVVNLIGKFGEFKPVFDVSE